MRGGQMKIRHIKKVVNREIKDFNDNIKELKHEVLFENAMNLCKECASFYHERLLCINKARKLIKKDRKAGKKLIADELKKIEEKMYELYM